MIIHLTGSSVQSTYLKHIADAADRYDDGALALPDHLTTPDQADWDKMIDVYLDAINRADAVIIEASDFDFFQGFQAAYAIEHKKPVLVVSRRAIDGHPLAGLKGKLCRVVEYHNTAQLETAVEVFIRDNTVHTKDLRFNLFIDRPIYNYLRTISAQTGKNKSEIIRDLINREINKKD